MLFFSLKILVFTLLGLKIKITILREILKALHVKTTYSSVTVHSGKMTLCRAAVLAKSCSLTKDLITFKVNWGRSFSVKPSLQLYDHLEMATLPCNPFILHTACHDNCNTYTGTTPPYLPFSYLGGGGGALCAKIPWYQYWRILFINPSTINITRQMQ